MAHSPTALIRSSVAMLRHHRHAHAALACIYAAMAVILAVEAAYAHAVCASVAAVVYGALCQPPGEDGPAADGE